MQINIYLIFLRITFILLPLYYGTMDICFFLLCNINGLTRFCEMGDFGLIICSSLRHGTSTEKVLFLTICDFGIIPSSPFMIPEIKAMFCVFTSFNFAIFFTSELVNFV